MTKRNSTGCPDPEVLAAFVAGSLSSAELETTAEHLRVCEDCRKIVAAGARFDREDTNPIIVEITPAPRPWWLVAAAVAFIGIGALSFGAIHLWRARTPIRTLIAATPREGRDLEARLSGGFPWAPLRSMQRGAESKPDTERMKLVGVAGSVLERTENNPSADAQHAAGLASLLGGHAKDAVVRLGNIARSSSDPRVWSDLAAARYVVAVQSDDPLQFAEALAAADKAIAIDPRLPEALFNRALILERLGLREQARNAWKRYLAADGSSAWAHEASEHLRALSKTSDFRNELDHDYDRLAAERDAAAKFARRFPQETRVWGESEILSRWAHDEIDGHPGRGLRHLQLARSFGAELARSHGDHLLLDAVTAIDGADASGRKQLAAAHIHFREAQRTFKERKLADAERQFRAAEAGFRADGSPMALLARYFAANTAYEQGRTDEARAQLERVLSDVSREYVSCGAQVRWQLGLAYGQLGRWGQSMRVLGESIADFDRLEEKNHAMTVREILAEVYDRIGEPREAWTQRLTALQELGQVDDLRLRSAIYAVARGAALNRDWPVSLSFLNLQMDMGRRHGDDLSYVTALFTRARIEGLLGDGGAARNDLTRAAAAMSSIGDAALRDNAEAERLAVEGFLARSPQSAILYLTNAIDHQRARGQLMFLPELLLQRGRAYVASGATAQAAADFDSGIRELETQRMSIDDTDARWGMFGAAGELFDEAVLLALQRHDDAAAFAYSEHARARELLDAMGITGVPMLGSVGDAIAVEYLTLPETLVIFMVDSGGVRAIQQKVGRNVLQDEARLIVRAAMSGSDADLSRAGRVLYNRLLAPLADELATGRTLIVVPDDVLNGVPFAALVEPAGKYVVERRAVVVAPSLAAYTRLAARRRPLASGSRLLIVSGPASRDGANGRLTAAASEADSVAAEYTRIADRPPRIDDATALERSAAADDVIHFVGHAVVPDDSAAPAIVTSRREGLEVQLDAREIASIHLRKTSVVVLAACGTARSHGRTGEASISIARAFLSAGVASVAATLWPIDDVAAAEFFPRIHHYLARGLQPAEALRAAQLEWIQRHDASAGVWAAVQIVGS